MSGCKASHCATNLSMRVSWLFAWETLKRDTFSRAVLFPQYITIIHRGVICFLIITNDPLIISLGVMISGFQSSLSSPYPLLKQEVLFSSHLSSNLHLLNDVGWRSKQANNVLIFVLTFQLQRLESLVLKPKKQMTQQYYYCSVLYFAWWCIAFLQAISVVFLV